MAASLMKRPPKLVLGTMNIGGSGLTDEASKEVVKNFRSHGHVEVDTALLYQGGETEKSLGRVLNGQEGIKLATKACPGYDIKSGKCTREPPQGGLQYLNEQCRMSLSALRSETVDLYYLHWPDRSTPLKDTLSTLKELHDEGRFSRWGLSNFETNDVVRICNMCKEMNILAPSVYQGMYNPLTRHVEEELLPVLRNMGISFYSYNPLAGGVLTGKHLLTQTMSSGRFNSETVWGKKYIDRYWNSSYSEAVEQLKKVCSSHSLSLTEASLRWLRLHSALVGELGDAIILGFSSKVQLEENVRAAEIEAELPIEVQVAFEAAWEMTKSSCPPYFR